MGDILALVERAQEPVDEKEAETQAKKLLEARFTFDDFYTQLQQVKKMGPIGDLLKMMPGMGGLAKQMPDPQQAERQMRTVEAIISSMTRAARQAPPLLTRPGRV